MFGHQAIYIAISAAIVILLFALQAHSSTHVQWGGAGADEIHDAKGKSESKDKRFRIDKALVSELSKAKECVDSEQHIQSLDDVEKDDLSGLRRGTLKRLCLE